MNGYRRKLYTRHVVEFELQADGHVRITKLDGKEGKREVFIPGEHLIELGRWLDARKTYVEIERTIEGRTP